MRKPKSPSEVADQVVGSQFISEAQARHVRMHALEGVLREIRKVYIEARMGKLASSDASKFVYMLNTAKDVVLAIKATDEFEQRVLEMEQRMGLARGESNVRQLPAPALVEDRGGDD